MFVERDIVLCETVAAVHDKRAAGAGVKDIPDNQYFPITDLINIIIKRGGRVGCLPITDGSWCDIGNWEDYTKALGRNA